MKTLILLIVASALAACSSTSKQQATVLDVPKRGEATALQLAESAFQESSGTLNLVFDAKGNWVKIISKGSAELSEDSPSARESALMIATMRAKRTVAEFLNNDVKSSKTLTRIARSYSRKFQMSETQDSDGAIDAPDDEAAENTAATGQSARSEKARQANRMASVLTERIRDGSSAIIKGAYVSYRSFDDGQVVVELTASRESIGAARSVSRLMSGVMK